MPTIAEIHITMDDKGQIQVNGPLENKLLMYGLLETARDVVVEHNANLAKRLVQPVTLGLPAGLGPRKID